MARPATKRSAALAAGVPPRSTRSATSKAARAILLTGGNIADITAAATLVSAVAPASEPVGDKGHDANHLRRFLAERGTAAVIPSTSSRRVAIPHDAERYRLRHVIERTCCRITDFRGIATRYGKTARNFASAVALVSAITWWT